MIFIFLIIRILYFVLIIIFKKLTSDDVANVINKIIKAADMYDKHLKYRIQYYHLTKDDNIEHINE